VDAISAAELPATLTWTASQASTRPIDRSSVFDPADDVLEAVAKQLLRSGAITDQHPHLPAVGDQPSGHRLAYLPGRAHH
jgi:hypothetical protein